MLVQMLRKEIRVIKVLTYKTETFLEQTAAMEAVDGERGF